MFGVFGSTLDRLYLRYIRNPQPSFHQRHAARRRSAWHIRSNHHDPIFEWETKAGGLRLAQREGVRVPALLAGPNLPSRIPWPTMPGRFVAKPDVGTDARGVLVLERNSGSTLTDWLTGHQITERDIPRLIGEDRPAVAVEFVGSPDGGPPDDWKFYCFDGVVGLILQIRRGSGGLRYRYYNPDWTDAGRAMRRRPVDASLPPPQDPAALRAAAERLSRSVSLPFVRVDLYEHVGEAVFGEFTYLPGMNRRFVLDVDRRLGELWDRAEARRAVRVSRRGAPQRPPER